MAATVPLTESSAKAVIANEIQQNGTIAFARFMELALYAPSVGYYRNALQKFGKGGDFVTAPEISPLFSRCIATQCAELLTQLSGGDILEFGAGSGIMAADILLALKNKNQLPNHYYILELSSALQAIQKKTIAKKIPDYLDRVIWLSQLPEKNFQGVVLANEVLDAMPVSRFCVTEKTMESYIFLENNLMVERFLKTNNAALIDAIHHIKNDGVVFQHGYISEINLWLNGWIKSISNFLLRGAVIIIDYGFVRREYYHPDRSMGTVMCHHQHRAHSDFFYQIGYQDITAHVDFTAVAEVAVAAGFSVDGFATQAAFLMNCDLLSEIDLSADAKTQQVMQLTSPSEMGELFKVIGLSTGCDFSWMGFHAHNQLEKL